MCPCVWHFHTSHDTYQESTHASPTHYACQREAFARSQTHALDPLPIRKQRRRLQNGQPRHDQQSGTQARNFLDERREHVLNQLPHRMPDGLDGRSSSGLKHGECRVAGVRSNDRQGRTHCRRAAGRRHPLVERELARLHDAWRETPSSRTARARLALLSRGCSRVWAAPFARTPWRWTGWARAACFGSPSR